MSTVPIIGGAAGYLRRRLPDVTIYCTCGIAFTAPTETAAVEAQHRHAAEMRNPHDHQGEVF